MTVKEHPFFSKTITLFCKDWESRKLLPKDASVHFLGASMYFYTLYSLFLHKTNFYEFVLA